MTLTDHSTISSTEQAHTLGHIASTSTPSESTIVESYPLAENEFLQAVWSGSDFHVYSNRLATSTIGECFLRPGRVDAVLYAVEMPGATAKPSTEVLISSLHELSGLTWDQIARALGVSKRTVLLWAGGARVSNKNHELVLSLKGLVDSFPGDPDTRRNALLASTPAEASPLVSWVQKLSAGETRVNAPVLPARALMG